MPTVVQQGLIRLYRIMNDRFMSVWGVVGVTVVVESRPPSGRYTLRTAVEVARSGG
ncbi:hypothetical protein [Salinispora vitiensis]|uniref:hypothetical protein n=1 Tax=Salinispora vitiensis TaxID=999544 RepID=UPI00036300A5|nr:hypothetical protein [Salinispora vitiensis]